MGAIVLSLSDDVASSSRMSPAPTWLGLGC
jgi:hypothetical protein